MSGGAKGAGAPTRETSAPASAREPCAAAAARTIRLAHSPDADDAFMFWALAEERVATPGYAFSHVLADIETLNQAALTGAYEVTACSIHAYPYIADRYALLNCGASMGEGYGPVLVGRDPLDGAEVARARVAVPGRLTSAFLALKLWLPTVKTVEVPFDRILQAVADGEVEAGLVIHEGQLTFNALGLHQIVDLGAWWREATGLPLPLGGNAVRRDLGREVMREVAAILRESIRYGLDHFEEALGHARRYGRDATEAQAARFVRMYVNPRTLDYGPDGRDAVRRFLAAGAEAGVLDRTIDVEFIGVDD